MPAQSTPGQPSPSKNPATAKKPEGFFSRFLPSIAAGAAVALLVTPLMSWRIGVALAERAEMRLEEKKKREIAEAVALEKQRMYQQVYESAPERYASSLGLLIGKAKADVSDNLSAERIEVSARAFVAARNELRDTMTSLSSSLDGPIDELEKALTDLQKDPNDKAAQDRVRKTILVIEQKWPVKAEAIKVQIRKMLAELGLERVLRGP